MLSWSILKYFWPALSNNQRLRLLSVLRRWFCCCWLFVYCNSHCGSLKLFYVLLYVIICPFAIILIRKRELVALLSLSSWCLVMAVWLFLAVPWVCLGFVIVVFPDHTIFGKQFLVFLLSGPLRQVILYKGLTFDWICKLECIRLKRVIS